MKTGKLYNMFNLAIHNAIIFAAEMHRNQFRKGTNIPYIVHPMEVMQILTENNCSTDVIVAGILHDVLEDTSATQEQVSKMFGERVLSLVKSETQSSVGTWKDRRYAAVLKIKEDSKDAQMVCCADKLSNIKSIYADMLKIGERVFERFNASKEDVKWYYQSMVEALNKIDDYKMKHELKTFVDKVFCN